MLSKYTSLILSITVVFLFYFGFGICKSIYPLAFGNCEDPITKLNVGLFTDLRYNIYAVVLCLFFIKTQIKCIPFKLETLILVIGIGFSLSDIIDRLYFDVTQFTKEDKSMIILTLILSYLEVYTKYNTKNISQYIVKKLVRK